VGKIDYKPVKPHTAVVNVSAHSRERERESAVD